MDDKIAEIITWGTARIRVVEEVWPQSENESSSHGSYEWWTKILLDAGANVSAVSDSIARRLKLKSRTNNNNQIDVQGIRKSTVVTTSRVIMKVTLWWELVNDFEVWIMPHNAGVDVILDTDFMIPAAIRLDIYSATIKSPDEIVVTLLRSSKEVIEQDYED